MTVQTQRNLTIAKAINEAIIQEMERDESVFLMGEDVQKIGAVWGHTADLVEKFGEERIRDTPISETAFMGAATGAAMVGMRPIVELMFVDFFGVCFDAIYNLAAKNSFFSGGRLPVPMVINTAIGGGYSDGGQHSQVLWSVFAHMPGLKVVCPSNAHDAKGLMMAAIRDNNPVVYMFHKQLQGMGFLGTVKRSVNHVPRDAYEVPLGQADVIRTGKDVTLVGAGLMVHHALDTASELEKEGVEAEVIDLRSLVPLDRDTVFESVKKTGRLVVVDDDYLSYGLTGEIIATVTERDLSVLKASPVRVAHPDVPIPYAQVLERFCLPNPHKIIRAVKKTLGR